MIGTSCSSSYAPIRLKCIHRWRRACSWRSLVAWGACSVVAISLQSADSLYELDKSTGSGGWMARAGTALLAAPLVRLGAARFTKEQRGRVAGDSTPPSGIVISPLSLV